MNIGLDLREWQNFPTGISRYFEGIVPELLKQGSNHFFFLFVSGDAGFVGNLPKGDNFQVVFSRFSSKSFIQFLGWQKQIRLFNLDWLITTPYGYVPGLKCHVALIIFDLLYHRYPNQAGFKFRLYQSLLEKRAASEAARIITISDFCAKDIQDKLSVPPNKLVITPLAVSPLLAPMVKIRGQRLLEGDYFLYVGNHRPHKNLPFLLNVFSCWFKQSSHRVKLALVGCDLLSKSKNTRALQHQVGELGISNEVIFFKDIDDAKLANLYQNAIALLIPSLFEGFGLSGLEALYFGCPVICSNLPVFYEFMEGYAHFVPVNNIDIWADSLKRVFGWPIKERHGIVKTSWDSSAGIILSSLS